MYTLDSYIENTYSLTKTLVIKIQDTALSINESLKLNYGLSIPDDKSLWKYYLNINGTKHSTNSDIEIFLKETGEPAILTKELLLTNELTKKELLKQGKYYENIIDKYPNDVMYINGILFPVPIQDAIDAPDGTILSYNEHFVEYNELSVIRELNNHTVGFVERWHLRDYTVTDNLYLTSMLGVLYSTIPNKLVNIRISKINTYEVNSFHLEHFFRSNLNIWEYVKVMNKESVMWLYNNMKYLLKNVGKENTLQLLVDKVLDVNGVGIGKYVLNRPDISTNTNNAINPMVPVYDKPLPYLTTTKLNNHYVTDNDNSRAVSDIVKLELTSDTTIDTDISTNDIVNYSEIVSNIVNDRDITSQDTKLLDLNSINIFDMHGVDQMQLTIDQWIYLSYDNRYSRTSEFRDPNTSLFYQLTPKQGLYVLLLLLQELTNNELPLTHYDYFSILNDNLNKNYLKTNLLPQDDNSEYVVDTILGSIPLKPNNIPNSVSFKEYVDSVISFYTKNNIIMSNVNNLSLIGNIKTINDRILKRGSIDLKIDGISYTPKELLNKDGITFITDGVYNYEKSISSLLKVFTGKKSNEYDDIREYLNGFINLLNRMTGYTTQIVSSVEDLEYVSIKHTGINVNSMPIGMATVTEATTVRVLENVDPEIIGSANNFETYITGYGKFNDVESCLFDNLSGIGISDTSNQELTVIYDKPTFIASLGHCVL